ncbi:MAG: FAD-binding oxidoreductase [Beijerinckiaceae bacterium]
MLSQYTSWGGLSTRPDRVLTPQDSSSFQLPDGPWLAYGNGRSYGDSCFPESGTLIDMRQCRQVISFDKTTGIIRAEAGLLLGDLIRLVADTGWFPAVVPGTQYVTLGGALANDIHGKNHHVQGSFGTSVRAFEILRSDGTRQVCSPDKNIALFCATIGGMGLTGVVTWVELQLMPVTSSDIIQEVVALSCLSDFFQQAEQQKELDDFPYTVAWIDSLATGSALGKGVLLKGRHARVNASVALPAKARVGVPFTPPVNLINTLSLRAFNTLYRAKTLSQKGPKRCSAGSFFFPLDAVGHWNKLYGPKGLRQHQCIIPLEAAEETIATMLETTQAANHGSFLTVLKIFGKTASPGLLSFPREGATLTLDFAWRGKQTDALLDRLDELALSSGGRISPYKDAHMSAETFQQSFPELDDFRQYMDPMARSEFASRVNLLAAVGRQGD